MLIITGDIQLPQISTARFVAYFSRRQIFHVPHHKTSNKVTNGILIKLFKDKLSSEYNLVLTNSLNNELRKTVKVTEENGQKHMHEMIHC